MVTISDWLKSYENLPSVTVHSTKHVEGMCKIVAGARSLFAKVGMTFSPSENLIFEFSLSEAIKERCENEMWMEHLCIGVLDVMLIGAPTPINQFRCSIDLVEYHEIDSTKQAFRLAGRNAAQKFLSEEPFNRLG